MIRCGPREGFKSQNDGNFLAKAERMDEKTIVPRLGMNEPTPNHLRE
jgi:hypothetical protein